MSQKWPTLWNCTHVQFIAAVYRLSIYTFGTGWGYRVQHLNNLTQKWEKNHTVNVITPTSKSNSHINLSDRECVVDMNVTHFALSLLSPQFDWIIDKYMPIPVHNKFNFQPTNTAKITRMNSTTYYTYPAESKSIEYIHDPLMYTQRSQPDKQCHNMWWNLVVCALTLCIRPGVYRWCCIYSDFCFSFTRFSRGA